MTQAKAGRQKRSDEIQKKYPEQNLPEILEIHSKQLQQNLPGIQRVMR